MKRMVMLIMLIFVVCGNLFAVNSPHPVMLELLQPDGITYPDAVDVTFSAYICSRPDDVITQDSDDCYYPYTFSGQESRKFIHFQCGSFVAQWAAGEYLCITASNGTVTKSSSILLTNDNFQAFSGTGLMESGVLPVTLSSFTATYLTDLPVLQWVTQSEQSNQGWNIYRNIEESPENSLQVNPELIAGSGTTSEMTQYMFTDEYNVETGITYYYWLESISMNGMVEDFGPVSLMIPEDDGDPSPEIPLVYGLHQNYPNPFNPATQISFAIESDGTVELAVFNVKGQKVKDIYTGYAAKDEVIDFAWEGIDNNGNTVGSGIYFCKLKTEAKTYTKKMNLIK
jgi:Secretion system C-terminal sorting domain